MKATDYLQQNAKGFEGDTILRGFFEQLILKHGIDTIIETGTYMGATTRQFSDMADKVITIEANEQYFNSAKDNIAGINNIEQHLGSSVHVLPLVIPAANGKLLFFLDAHWGDNNPLLQELAIIALAGLKPVIAIHDFKVPNHPELGFDTYNGQDYEWSWIQSAIEAIYGPDGYNHYYNTDARGAKRGVVFIEPK